MQQEISTFLSVLFFCGGFCGGFSYVNQQVELQSTKNPDCLSLLYEEYKDPHTNKISISKREITMGGEIISYYKVNSKREREDHELRIDIEKLSDDAKLSLHVKGGEMVALKSLTFKIKGSEEEIVLDITYVKDHIVTSYGVTSGYSEYYADFGKGTKNLEKLNKIAPAGTIAELRSSSVDLKRGLATAEIEDGFRSGFWHSHSPNRGTKLPLLSNLRVLVNCKLNPPVIPKDYILLDK